MTAVVHIAIGAAAAPAASPGWWSANILTVLTLASGLVAGLFAGYRWRSDENWKRTAAALERVKSFGDTPGTRNAMMILKSHKRPIPIFDAADPPKDGSGIYCDVTWADAKTALVPTRWNDATSPLSNAIRDSFEDFIGRMVQIEIYVAGGLITIREARPLVAPWGQRLSWDGDGGLARNLRVYVELEGYTAFQDLFGRFGCDLRAGLGADIRQFRKEHGIADDPD